MECFFYVIVRDFGFAPNPFGGYCTLATCKPGIRKTALVGDLVVATGSAKRGLRGKVVCAMLIDEKLEFNQYWEDARFIRKKPVMNGSLKQMYGDNIYYFDVIKKSWVQIDSHHSLPGGVPNLINKKKDLSGKYVLISQRYWYFGNRAVRIPSAYVDKICAGRGHRRISDTRVVLGFLDWLQTCFPEGYHADPLEFDKQFTRYDGVS